MGTIGIESLISVLEISSKFHLIKFFSNFSGTLQDLWWLLGVVVILIICIVAIVFFCRKTHKATNITIEELKKNKKYIPKVFVELNEGKEILRYFIYGTKWKKRIIKEFNNIYHNAYGKILKKAVGKNDRCFHLKNHAKISNILDLINKKLELHEKFRCGKYKLIEEFSESQILFEICYSPYHEALSRLLRYTQSAVSNYIILTGSAGNGKTNLLCSISELIMSLNDAVIFVTAREIKNNPEIYILDCLEVPGIFKKYSKWYWKLENFLLRIRRKYFYIVIDAVNENENENFSEELMLFINKMLLHNRFKVIVSCRNEYYETRFKKNLVDKVNVPAFELDIKDGKYNEAALDRIIEVYRSYFNFKGNISKTVKNILSEQLLLLRIFFETNEDSEEDVLSICKHEVFKEYIKKIAKQTSIDIERILCEIAKIMLEKNRYDGIQVSVLNESGLDIGVVKKTIDESILISKKIVTNEGTIAEVEREEIYFVFDELRDYVLSREIFISNSDEKGIVNSHAIVQQILKLKEINCSALEGVLHYTYMFFRCSEKSEEVCSCLLDLIKIPNNPKPHSYYGMRHRIEFKNIGLRIILTSGLVLTEFEKNYIRDCLVKNPYEDGGIVFDVMLNGTIHGGVYDLNTYLDILFRIQDINSMKAAFKTMIAYNSISNYYLPVGLIKIHESLCECESNAAMQVQRVAEFFLIIFKMKDQNKEDRLKNYFYNLSNHNDVYEAMMEKIRNLW